MALSPVYGVLKTWVIMIGFSKMCFVYSRLGAEFYIGCCGDHSFTAVQINDVETESIVHVGLWLYDAPLKWSDLTK